MGLLDSFIKLRYKQEAYFFKVIQQTLNLYQSTAEDRWDGKVPLLVGGGELLEMRAEAKSLCRDQVLAGSWGDLWARNVWWGEPWILKQMNMAEMLKRLSKSGRALWFVASSWSLLRVWREATEHFFFFFFKKETTCSFFLQGNV